MRLFRNVRNQGHEASALDSGLDCSLLLRQVGLANAKRILFSGRAFEVEECRSLGLLDMTARTGSALEAARAYADELSASAPLSIAGAKLVLEALERGDGASGHAGSELLDTNY